MGGGRGPHLVSGSADLEPSTLTLIKAALVQKDDYSGRNTTTACASTAWGRRKRPLPTRPEGLRSHLLQLLRLHEGRDAAGVDHAPAVDLVFTHDSIGWGRTGTPTSRRAARHLRATPTHYVLRPRARRAALGWRFAIEQTETPCRSSSAQGLHGLEPGGVPDDAIHRGAYGCASRTGPEPTLILIATGVGGAPLHGGEPTCSKPRDRDSGGVDAVMDASRSRTRTTRTACCRRRCGRASRSRRRPRSAGTRDDRGRRPDRHEQLRGLRAPARAVRHFASPGEDREKGRDVVKKVEQAGARAVTQQVAVNERWRPSRPRVPASGSNRSAGVDRVRGAQAARGRGLAARSDLEPPAIFEKAIMGSTDYDEDIERPRERASGRRDLREHRDSRRSTRGRGAAPDLRRGGGVAATCRSRSSPSRPRKPMARSPRRETCGSESTLPT